MENKWERFDNIVKPEVIMEAKAQFDPIEPGVYKMIVESMEAGESKTSGAPMLKGRFRLAESNRVLFYNQVLQVVGQDWLTERNIVEVVVLLEGMIGEEIEFEGLGQLGSIAENIPVGSEHYIEVSYGDKDHEKSFPELKVAEKPAEIEDEVENTLDEDIPF